MTGTRTLGLAATATAGVLIAIALAGAERGLALYAYLLLLCALALALLRQRIRASFPVAIPLESRVRKPASRDERIQQLEALSQRIAAAETSTFDLHYRLRPVLRQIVAARLARRHGVDLDRDPERSRMLVGEELWELVRPDREPPEERFARGLSNRQVDGLIDRVEAL